MNIFNPKYVINNPTGKITIAAGNNNDIPEILTIIPSNFDKLIGREKELDDINLLVKNVNNPILVRGMGGVGKSTLIKEYLKLNIKEFKYKIWLTQDSNDICSTIANNDQLLFSLGIIWNESMTIEMRANAFFDKIAGLNGNNLLIIDNLSYKGNEQFIQKLVYLGKGNNWKVLATSRDEIYGFDSYDVGALNREDSIKLFKKFNNRFEDVFVSKIVDQISCNPLGIELVSKTFQENHNLNMEDFFNIKKDSQLPKIRSEHNYQENDLIDHLVWLFDITKSNLAFREIWLLKQFLVFPNDPFFAINPDFLLSNLYFESRNVDFRQLFIQLEKKGWIIKSLKGKDVHFQLHSLVKIALNNSITLTYPDDLQDISLDLIRLLRIDDTKKDFLNSMKYIEFGENLLRYLPDNNEDKAIFLDVLAGAFDLLGNLEKAGRYREEALSISKEVDGFEHLSTRHHNLGNIELSKGNYKKAIECFKKALFLNVDKKNPFYIERTLISRLNLSVAYASRGQLAKAITQLQQILNEYQAISIDHPRVGQCYYYLAREYYHIWEFDTALSYIEKAIVLDKNLYGEFDIRLASKLNLLAKILRNQGRFDEARDVYKNCIIIFDSLPEHFQSYLELEIKELHEFESNVAFINQALENNKENIIKDQQLYPEIPFEIIRLLYVGYTYGYLAQKEDKKEYLQTSVGMLFFAFVKAKSIAIKRNNPFIIEVILPNYRHIKKYMFSVRYKPAQIVIEERIFLYGNSGMPDSNVFWVNVVKLIFVLIFGYYSYNMYSWIGGLLSFFVFGFLWNFIEWTYRQYIVYSLKKL